MREVEKSIERRNQHAVRLRVLLPYFTPLSAKYENDMVVYEDDMVVHDGIEYEDPAKLLQRDARQEWWKNFGMLTGKHFEGLPKELNRKDLAEITAQPLLNYLIALSFTLDKLDFSKDINLILSTQIS